MIRERFCFLILHSGPAMIHFIALTVERPIITEPKLKETARIWREKALICSITTSWCTQPRLAHNAHSSVKKRNLIAKRKSGKSSGMSNQINRQWVNRQYRNRIWNTKMHFPPSLAAPLPSLLLAAFSSSREKWLATRKVDVPYACITKIFARRTPGKSRVPIWR